MKEIEIVAYTPIRVADIAIGTCWDVQKPETDKARMLRVANKFKHMSTIEHLSISYSLPVKEANFFLHNHFSIATVAKDGKFNVTTNARVLLEAMFDETLPLGLLKYLVPDEYKFFFEMEI